MDWRAQPAGSSGGGGGGGGGRVSWVAGRAHSGISQQAVGPKYAFSIWGH